MLTITSYEKQAARNPTACKCPPGMTHSRFLLPNILILLLVARTLPKALPPMPDPPLPAFAHALAGASGGFATVLLLHPLDTLKTNLQSDTSPSPSARRALRALLASGGVPALYRGAAPALVGAGASWAFYMHCFHFLRGTSPVPNAASDFLAGSTAGLLTALATNPVWVVKVRLQLQRAAGGPVAPVYGGMFDAFVRIGRDEGLRGLYKGLGPSLWLVSHGAIQFTLYEQFKLALRQRRESDEEGTSVQDSLVASTASKLAAAVATYPLQLVRTRMQEVGGERKYASMGEGFMRVVRTEGLRGLYRGLGANVARVMPQSAVTFVTYEQVLKLCSYFARE